jgi:hypothetical protein
MSRKHILLFIACLFFFASACTGAFFIWLFSGESAPPHQASFFLSALDINGKNSVQSGDVILWSTSSIKSLLVEEMTDGVYSHAGLLHEGPDKTLWALDIYPKKGLRHERLEDYLKDSKNPITRVAVFRCKFKPDKQLLEECIQNIIRPDHTISFNESMIYNGISLEELYKKGSTASLYCTELVLKILEKAAAHALYIDNDFERVMTKWQMVLEGKQINGMSPITAVKKFYLRAKLGQLKNSRDKKLMTPNGIARSPDFEIIRHVEGNFETSSMKKDIAQMPVLMEPSNPPKAQK